MRNRNKQNRTQKEWNILSCIGIALALFSFACNGLKLKLTMIAVGVFVFFFCAFPAIRIVSFLISLIAMAILSLTLMSSLRNEATEQTPWIAYLICFTMFASSLVGLYSTFSKAGFDLVDVIRKKILDRSKKKMETEENEGKRVGTAKDENDILLPAAVEIVLDHGTVSTSLIQRQLKTGYSHAVHLILQMEKLGFIGRLDKSYSGIVYLTREQWRTERSKLLNSQPNIDSYHEQDNTSKASNETKPVWQIDSTQIINDEEQWLQKNSGLSPVDFQMKKIDLMDGTSFERWCGEILKKKGYSNISYTPVTEDQGVDILAEKDDIKYAIQCKCYSSDLGNTPIQEVVAGKNFYHCHVGVVITNRYFTSGGLDLARANGVLLWDRNWIIGVIQETLSHEAS